MAESVTVDQGGTSITTNTMSEADLRAEMQAPQETAPPAGSDAPPAATPAQAAPVRDDKGRFAPKADGALPLESAAPVEAAPAEPPARRRDDTLPRHDPMARMKQALAQKAEAERRAQALEAELTRVRQASVTSPVTPAPVQPAPGHAEPQFEQFANEADPYTAYVQAWTRWDRAQALTAARQEWESELTAKERAKEFTTRLQTGKKEYADFDQVLTEADTLGLQVSAVMQEAIAASPQAADLVYFLATHPEECTQLAEESQFTPVAAAAVMRRLLESHLAPRAAPANNGSGPAARAPVSTAKPPVTPVGSSPVVGDEPPGDSASAADHARYWNRRLKVPGTR